MHDAIDDPREFTDEQMHAALRRMGEEARAKAFAIGRPIMIARDGKLFLHFSNGEEKEVDTDGKGNGRE